MFVRSIDMADIAEFVPSGVALAQLFHDLRFPGAFLLFRDAICPLYPSYQHICDKYAMSYISFCSVFLRFLLQSALSWPFTNVCMCLFFCVLICR